MKLYMKVTKDKYELPLCVAESIVELSHYTGSSTNTINAVLSKKRNGVVSYDFGYKEVELHFDYEKFAKMYERVPVQKEFAQAICVSPTAVVHWLEGRGCPLYAHVLNMAEYFGVDEEYFLKEVPV